MTFEEQKLPITFVRLQEKCPLYSVLSLNMWKRAFGVCVLGTQNVSANPTRKMLKVLNVVNVIVCCI